MTTKLTRKEEAQLIGFRDYLKKAFDWGSKQSVQDNFYYLVQKKGYRREIVERCLKEIGVTLEKGDEFLEEKTEKKNPYKKLHYATDHLPLYHEFSSLTGLYGRHYIPILKARWYQLVGGILQKQVRLGGLLTDTRIHIAYPLVTEGGKNEIIYSIKSLIETGIEKSQGNQFKISEPISYSPESLIGKVVERLIDNPAGKPKKIKVRIENKGHFDNDFLEFDECTKLISSKSPEDQQAREYLSKAENPIGKNKVEKRLVDDTPEERVGYCPSCTNSYYFQPYEKIPEQAMLQGFMRRKLIPIGNIDLFLNSASESLYNSKLEDINFSIQDYQERIIRLLENIIRKLGNIQFIFTDEAKKLIRDYGLYLNAQGQLHSEKINNYCKITKWTALGNLVKMSCIVSASYLSHIVNENSVSLAFMDLVELSQNTFDFIDSRVAGDLDYGSTWKNSNYKQRECLKYLYNKKALSLESSDVSIQDFLEKAVAPIFNVKDTQARQKYLDMKNDKLIDSDQIGKTETRVWLNFNPKMHETYSMGDKGYRGYDTYNSIFLAKNSIVGALKSSSPSQPLKITLEKPEVKFDPEEAFK